MTRNRSLTQSSLCTAILLLFAITGTCFLNGCGEEDTSQESPTAYHKDFSRADIRWSVSTNTTALTVADTLHLTLEVTVPESWEVSFPDWGTTLDGFDVQDSRTQEPTLTADAHMLHVCQVELAPPLPPQATLPALTINVRKKATSATKASQTLLTEPINVQIRSLWDEKDEATLREISGPVTIPWTPTWKHYAALGAVIALLIAVAVRLYINATKPKPVYTPPAHVIAMEALQALLGMQLMQKGETKRYYQELSDVLRHYIENRFDLRAPERTTEEFLEDLRSTDRLNAQQKNLLEEFLTQCDLVKFARHLPTLADAEAAFAACRRFVTETQQSASEQSTEEGGTDAV